MAGERVVEPAEGGGRPRQRVQERRIRDVVLLWRVQWRVNEISHLRLSRGTGVCP
jgi:hypothetical protein